MFAATRLMAGDNRDSPRERVSLGEDSGLHNGRLNDMRGPLIGAVTIVVFAATVPAGPAGQPGSPEATQTEKPLPSRYPYVVKDVLKYCEPRPGFWVDLGAGKGQVAIPLVEATSNPVVMLDPDVEAMSEGLRIAREKGLRDRVFAVVGVAENMPFPDSSVDLVVSRGSIFFWDDPVKGLQEVYRVLSPGGKAMIGGGAGSGYPEWAAEELIRRRQQKLNGEDAERWKRFVELRRPETMRGWAKDAKLPNVQVAGKGAVSAADPRTGQGVWLWFTKEADK